MHSIISLCLCQKKNSFQLFHTTKEEECRESCPNKPGGPTMYSLHCTITEGALLPLFYRRFRLSRLGRSGGHRQDIHPCYLLIRAHLMDTFYLKSFQTQEHLLRWAICIHTHTFSEGHLFAEIEICEIYVSCFFLSTAYAILQPSFSTLTPFTQQQTAHHTLPSHSPQTHTDWCRLSGIAASHILFVVLRFTCVARVHFYASRALRMCTCHQIAPIYKR